MDVSCHWRCRDEPTTDDFCIGGTDMYMQGFDVRVLVHLTIKCNRYEFLILVWK